MQQYVDVMLISTIVGGVVQAIGAIAQNPLSIINTLAESLPKVCKRKMLTHAIAVSFIIQCSRLVHSLSHM